MRLLLLLFFFAAGTQAFSVNLKNNCQYQITVTKSASGSSTNIYLNPGETRQETVAYLEKVRYTTPGTVAAFGLIPYPFPATNYTHLSLEAQGTDRDTILQPLCGNCPVLWCENAGCKKTGDGNFNNYVQVYVPTSDTSITYCPAH